MELPNQGVLSKLTNSLALKFQPSRRFYTRYMVNNHKEDWRTDTNGVVEVVRNEVISNDGYSHNEGCQSGENIYTCGNKIKLGKLDVPYVEANLCCLADDYFAGRVSICDVIRACLSPNNGIFDYEKLKISK